MSAGPQCLTERTISGQIELLEIVGGGRYGEVSSSESSQSAGGLADSEED